MESSIIQQPTKMSPASPETPNPLRPYYRPPSIGIAQDPLTNQSSSGSTHGLGAKNGSAASYASSAREIFSEYDYTEYLSDSSPSALESLHKQINEWMYRYLSTLLSQPFEVAKTILQVKTQTDPDGVWLVEDAKLKSRNSLRDGNYSNQYPEDEDSDPDELAYFTSHAPHSTGTHNSYHDTYSHFGKRQDLEKDGRSGSPPRTSPSLGHQLSLKRSDSILEVMSQEWMKEGAWGVWKGSNLTFIYGLLYQTLERWARGLLSAILNLPDPSLTAGVGVTAELVDTSYPWASLAVAIAASVSAGVILAPLDLIRTKLIVAPITASSRSLTQQIRHLPSYLCPPSLLLPTTLHSLITPTLLHSTPLVLQSNFSVDPVLTPNAYSMAKFLSRTLELFLKLPLETVLRRGQVAVLCSPQYNEAGRRAGKPASKMDMVVDVGEFNGVLGTMWCIAKEEGTRQETSVKNSKSKGKGKLTKGQGIEGLWRGWRVGMWGLAGVWAAGFLGNGGAGGEF